MSNNETNTQQHGKERKVIYISEKGASKCQLQEALLVAKTQTTTNHTSKPTNYNKMTQGIIIIIKKNQKLSNSYGTHNNQLLSNAESTLAMGAVVHDMKSSCSAHNQGSNTKTAKHFYTLPFRKGVGVCQQQRNEIKTLV